MIIGVFDSGVGGLWILKNLKEALPEHNYIYFGDQAHVPYGKRSMEEIKNFSEEITRFLIDKGCQIIVIACNTASAAALKYLREKYPDTIFIGMEPAVKPATEITKTKKVLVLATPATFQGELYNSVVERFAKDVEIFKDTCPGLVLQIEKGELDNEKTKKILEKALKPISKEGIDTIVLGCTHYPFVISLIKKITTKSNRIVGSSDTYKVFRKNKINVIDPTPAIVKRVESLARTVLARKGEEKENIEIFTSGKPAEMKILLDKLFDKNENVNINQISWKNNLTLNMLE